MVAGAVADIYSVVGLEGKAVEAVNRKILVYGEGELLTKLLRGFGATAVDNGPTYIYPCR